jgi:hypothetical protein
MKGDSMSGMKRRAVLALTLSLSLLPLASAHAAPRDRDVNTTTMGQIQRFGRNLLQWIERSVGLPEPMPTSGSLPDPGTTDGVGIDPHGGGLPKP